MAQQIPNSKFEARSRHRPVDLPLLKMRLPITGIVSITHRITGVLLVLAIPLAIWLLELSLSGEAGFVQVRERLSALWPRFLLILLLITMLQHSFSGLRHLLQDIHIGLDRKVVRKSAWLCFGATALCALVLWGLG